MERFLILLYFFCTFSYFLSYMSKLLYLHQTFNDCVSIQYWYVKIPDGTPIYEKPLNFIIFYCEFCTKLTNIHVWSVLPSPLSSRHIHKLCIWCEYNHFIIIKFQMWPQVIEHSLILLCFFRYFLILLPTIHISNIVSSPNFHRLCI